jgi:hypothetical protein
MKSDLFPHFSTLTQKQIGEHFGVSSVIVGRWLKEAGLRQRNGEPTQAAIDAGFAEPVDLGDGTRPFWAWRKKMVEFLEKQGHVRPLVEMPDAPPQNHLTGPFTSRSNDGDGHEILDSNGVVGVWVRGEENAKEVVMLMNLSHERRGLWKGSPSNPGSG